MALVTTAIVTSKENPLIAIPKAVPDAGGCSVSVTTIMKIESPTANEYTIIEGKNKWCGINAHKYPEISPTK